MKSAIALALLGVCAVVLVVHVANDQQEDVKEFEQDPFLASIEAHVVAVAQKRLRARASKHASDNHISEARKAIKAALLNAATINHKKSITAQPAELAAAPTVNKAPKKKTYTWAELQAGADAKEDKVVKKSVTDTKAMGSLLNKLKAAPVADRQPKQTMLADVVKPHIDDVVQPVQEPAYQLNQADGDKEEDEEYDYEDEDEDEDEEDKLADEDTEEVAFIDDKDTVDDKDEEEDSNDESQDDDKSDNNTGDVDAEEAEEVKKSVEPDETDDEQYADEETEYYEDEDDYDPDAVESEYEDEDEYYEEDK